MGFLVGGCCLCLFYGWGWVCGSEVIGDDEVWDWIGGVLDFEYYVVEEGIWMLYNIVCEVVIIKDIFVMGGFM